MDFVDEVTVEVKAGKGGDGNCSFRREKFIEFGGPNGGDGGKGGDVKFIATENISTLLKLKYNPHIKAESGKRGGNYNKTGEHGADVIVKLPLGTQVFDEWGNLLFDLSYIGQEEIVAKGGIGGVGNYRFKSSTNRAPRQFTYGEEGELKHLSLKLKLIADVGIIGFPNIGKSTFLASCSAARPKIANYPFTTLKPNLGVVVVGYNDFVLADIPGIIKGAHLGLGLGHKFLKHIERCKVLLHMIDGSISDLKSAYKTTLNELKRYNQEILNKEEIIALTKCDLLSEEEIIEKKFLLAQFTKKQVFAISYEKRADELLRLLAEIIIQGMPKDKAYDPYYVTEKRKSS